MIKTFAILAALALGAPAIAQTAAAQGDPAPKAVAQSWPVMSDHTLDMPAQGAHSRSRPWLKMAATPASKGKRTKRSG